MSLLSSCSDDNNNMGNNSNKDLEIFFTAQSFFDGKDMTRANNDLTDLTSDKYNSNFHIFINAKDATGETLTRSSAYQIPSGFGGTLIPAPEEPTLSWLSREGDHNIWSWTLPWDPGYKIEKNDDNLVDDITFEFKDTFIWETTNTTASSWNENSWKNGACLEQFVGATFGPDNYGNAGQFVPLNFRHLVSKILIGSFAIVDNSTAVSTSARGNITIYGLPKDVKLHTTPLSDPDESGIRYPVRPYISMTKPSDEGVTYAITYSYLLLSNDAGTQIQNPFATTNPRNRFYDCWYICPEVDLSVLSFKIEIYEASTVTLEDDTKIVEWKLSKKYGQNGAFYGDFKNIQLSRTPNNKYDEGNDNTILHAGEYLVLGINLTTNGNPGIRGTIFSWDNPTQDRGASTHDRPGLYTQNDLKDFSSAMKSGDEDRMTEYFEVFGSGERTDDGKGIFKLYEDVGSVSEIYVDDDYMLDGMGHTITGSSSSITVSPNIRDVYFQYSYGSTSVGSGQTTYYYFVIYIDNDGNIWKVNPDTYERNATEYNINNPGTNPVKLNIMSGSVTA